RAVRESSDRPAVLSLPHRPAARPRLHPARRPLSTDSVRAAFDRVAEQYAVDFADELSRKPWDVERLRRFAAACPPGPILEIGCGPAGHIARYVRRPPPGRHRGRSLRTRPHPRPAPERVAALRDRGHAVAADPVGHVSRRPGVLLDDLRGYGRRAGGAGRVSSRARQGGALLIAVHAGDGVRHVTDYKGISVDITLHLRDPDGFATLVRSAGFTLQACEFVSRTPSSTPRTDCTS